METQPEIPAFVRALSNADRLRVIGALTLKPTSAKEIAENLSLFPDMAFAHLVSLSQCGIAIEKDGVWQLVAQPTQNRLPEFYVPELNEKARRVLAAYINEDGSLKQIPARAGKLQVILDYIVESFPFGLIYTEKEVNMIIRRFHLDTSGLRRDLIDRGMLMRKSDGSQYWRPA